MSRLGFALRAERRRFDQLDWPLVVTMLFIVGVGLLNLYSAIHGTKHAAKFDQQLMFVAMGVMLFSVVAAIDYHLWIRLAWWGIGGVLLLLIIVALMGTRSEAKGSSRWLMVGGYGIQPSEFAKLAIIIALARVSEQLGNTTPQRYAYIALAMAPVGLIAIQPDLGTASICALVATSIGLLVLRDIRPILLVWLPLLIVAPFKWDSLHRYQQNRIMVFLDPSLDPHGIGWQLRQSKLGIGSGQVFGKGYLEGTQNRFDFLPEHWTDFPFAVWAEEWGFLGSAGLVLAFALLVYWCLSLAFRARDRAGAIICVGVAALVFWHAVINIAMVIGMAPVVGVTLPFISYGGSSLLTFFIALGLAASVGLRKHG